jgi:hypothetical protein
VLASDPRDAGGRRVVFVSGDDAAAKAMVGRLIEQLGFSGIDLGSLAIGGKLQQFPGGPLPALNSCNSAETMPSRIAPWRIAVGRFTHSSLMNFKVSTFRYLFIALIDGIWYF